MQSRRKYQSIRSRLPFSLICSYRPEWMLIDEFKSYIEAVLSDENVSKSDYNIKMGDYFAFVHFSNKEDMLHVLKNRKYDDIDGFLIRFNKPNGNNRNILYIIGIPKGTTARELDDIL